MNQVTFLLLKLCQKCGKCAPKCDRSDPSYLWPVTFSATFLTAKATFLKSRFLFIIICLCGGHTFHTFARHTPPPGFFCKSNFSD
jgi:hypothetical protein